MRLRSGSGNKEGPHIPLSVQGDGTFVSTKYLTIFQNLIMTRIPTTTHAPGCLDHSSPLTPMARGDPTFFVEHASRSLF